MTTTTITPPAFVLLDAIEASGGIRPEIVNVCRKAFNARTGMLLSRRPKGTGLEAEAWSRLMLEANVHKVGIMGMIMSRVSKEDRAEIEAVATLFKVKGLHKRIDKDRMALESLGAW